MKDEEHSIFDGFETDDVTGEVIIPRATVGVAPDDEHQEEENTAGEVKKEEDLFDFLEAGQDIDTWPETDVSGLPKDSEETAAPKEEKTETESSMEELSEEEKGIDDASETDTGAAAGAAGDLPELSFDFNFSEEELVDKQEVEEEDEEILRSIDEALEEQMEAAVKPEELAAAKDSKKKKNFFTRIPLGLRIALTTVFSLCLICLFLVVTKPGRSIVYGIAGWWIGNKTGEIKDFTPTPSLTLPPTTTQTPDNPKKTPTPVPTLDPEQNPVGATVTPSPFTPTPTIAPRQEDYIYNVLLIGEESLAYFGGGHRSDSMMIASIDSKQKKIHLTSLLRDMYVHIPGYVDDRLNTSYALGGKKLLVETIERNLQIKIDGSVIVGFDDFEDIINKLGGVEITLTAAEADYLKRTRYITKPEYRNVTAGTQVLNGNQVLGFCRVRYVPTINGTTNDYGRTERQRTVLKKLFDTFKEKPLLSLFGIMNDCLPLVSTDISNSDISKLLETVVENRIFTMDTLRIPYNGAFENVKIDGKDVLAVNWKKNIERLQEFIFGPAE